MSILVAALIKTTIVLAGALALSRALRHHSAAARHLVWTCGLLAALALPLASLAVPRWEIPLVTLESVASPVRSVEAEESLDPNVAAMEARLRDGRMPLAPTPSDGTGDVNPSAATAPSWTTVAIGIWAVGAIALLGRLLVGIVAVRLMARRTEPAADAAWVPVASELARDLGVTHVEFRRGERGTMPTAWGVLRPVVLMPADADAWPETRLRVVLLHELAHVKRADCLTHILAQAACAIHWINPLAWTAVRQARIERERACDDLVLTRGTSDVHYADQLLEIARAMRASRFSAAMAGASLAMAHRSQLEGRLMAILDPSVPRTPLSRARAAAAGAFAFAALIPLASVQPFAYAVVPRLPVETRPAAKPAATTADTTQQPTARPTPVADSLVASQRASGTTDAAVDRQQPTPKPNPNPNPNPNPGRDDDEQGKAADPKVIAALMTALKDSDKDVRETAMQALVRLRAPGMFEPLVDALKDPSPHVREQAAFGLGQLRDKRAVAPLTAALKDSAANVREQAVFALGQLRDASTIDALTIALRDESASVREQAAFALGQLRDEKSVPPLVSALKDASPGVREQAAFALGQIRSQTAVDALMAALKDSSEGVREQAAFALGQLGDARALDALTAALKDASADVRQQAAFAIGQLAR